MKAEESKQGRGIFASAPDPKSGESDSQRCRQELFAVLALLHLPNDNERGETSRHYWMNVQFRARRIALIPRVPKEAAARRDAGIHEDPHTLGAIREVQPAKRRRLHTMPLALTHRWADPLSQDSRLRPFKAGGQHTWAR
jgi:hypothetical protein